MAASPKLEDVELAIGKLVIAWSVMEHMLNACLISLHRDHDGHTIEPEIPEPLARRLRYFKKAIRAAKIDGNWIEYAADIAGEIKTLSAIRHDCIHGSLSLFLDEQAPAILTVFRPTTQTTTETPVSLEAIDHAERRAMAIGTKLGLLAIMHLKPIAPERLQELLGELPGELVAAIKKT